jgi:putative ABC transport system substrate-binding protein
MRRRELITLLGSAAAWPLAARAQQASKPPTIGFLDPNSASAQVRPIAAFVQRLRELGWNEGQNLAIEYRWTEGRVERSTELANELVRLRVDVIVAAGTAVAVAAKKATTEIPIVFPIAGDPVESGLVASLSRPDGNATGLSLMKTDLAPKRLELLREGVPGVLRLAILANASYPAAAVEMQEVQAAAQALGLAASRFEIRRAEDIVPAFDSFKDRAEALYVCGDPLIFTYRVRVTTLALGARLPTIYDNGGFVEAGGLMSYGPSFADMFRRSAAYVDKILRGARPADLPVEQPTKFDFVVNLTTAMIIGLTVPPTLLAIADEVIE